MKPSSPSLTPKAKKGATSLPSSGLKQGNLFSFFSKKKKDIKTPPPLSSSSSSSGATKNKKNTASSMSIISQSPTPSSSSSTPTTTAAATTASQSVRPKTSTAATTATTSTATTSRRSTNSLWKQVQVGDKLRVLWPDDQQYYAARVLKTTTTTTTTTTTQDNHHHHHPQQQFQLEYDDGDQEWLDLSMETFSILSKATKTKTNTKSTTITTNDSTAADDRKRRRRRQIAEEDEDDDDEDDEEEHEWKDNEDSDDDGSVFEAKDTADDDDDDDEDEADQWMVTDEEDNDDLDDLPSSNHKKKKKQSKTLPARKKAKKMTGTSLVKVTEHSSTPNKSRMTSTTTTTTTSSASFKTPLRQFANTVSPNTDSMSTKKTPSPSSYNPHSPMRSLTSSSSAVSSPLATTTNATNASRPSSNSNGSNGSNSSNGGNSFAPKKALPYVKGVVNIKGAHVHNHLRFVQDPKDANGRRRNMDPGYNPKTLKVIPSEWNTHVGKMTNAVQQWWDLKAQYFDTVLLFKTGKFYEMFHMDADVGVDVLQLSYMKGHIAHAGFPEISYGPMADKLVRAGYKVARVEQTETPQQLKERKARTKGKKPGVVNREVCSIVSLGTRTFCALDDEKALSQIDMHTANGSAAGPLLAISEIIIDSMELDEEDTSSQVQPVCEYGITMVDALRGSVTVGQFADDILRSRMNTLLARLTPSEIIYQDSASPTLQSLLKTYQSTSRSTCRLEVVQEKENYPRSTALNPEHRRQLERSSTVRPWNVEETLAELHRRQYYPKASKKDTSKSTSRWPLVLQALVEGEARLCLASFGAALFYLQRHLIDQEILSMGIVQAYIPETSVNLSDKTGAASTTLALQDSLQQSSQAEESSLAIAATTTASPLSALPDQTASEEHITYLSLDGTTLYNLEILTNSVDHKVAGSLWNKINYCKSPHGSRFLRAWLLRPLFRKADIDRRADAVQELAGGGGAVALQEARQSVLGKIGDLDRLLSRIHSMSGAARGGPTDAESTAGSNGDASTNFHPADRAVLYESAVYTKRKVNDFSKVLGGLRKACQIPELFADLSLAEDGLLAKLVRLQSQGGCFPDMVEELDFFFDNFDCEKASRGQFEPSRGVDEGYDEACDAIERIKDELEDYRRAMCEVLRPKHVAKSQWKYINTMPTSKDKYLIELPASVEVPEDFIFKAKRGSGHKQVNKYSTNTVAQLVHEMEQAIDIKETRKAKGMELIFAKFDSKRNLWRAAAHATAMLDALGSLAKVASKPGFCRPTILECPPDQEPTIDIVQGRHPCVENSSIHSTEFIPNDLRLGGANSEGDAARLLLLSGPNMGGKSTLLRQTCLIAILAQLGSYVPAESCSLTPVDCIYTRLGASDRILLGQSTFFVELAETAAALRGATRRSLVIMDELGRGTSTFDGTAIAGATVKHLIERSQCLSLFATHYHSLLDEWDNEPMVRLGHMQCMVEDSDESDNDHSITFLYTLGPGTCPKSFGINVAKLASLPPEVLDNAKKVSQEFEEEMAGSSTKETSRDSILATINTGKWEDLERLWSSLQN